MAQRIRNRRCRHCKTFFFPDRRNIDRQQFCSKPECRTASKAASQRKWLEKNPDYFRGREQVQRVREWRQTHPGYRRRGKDPCLKGALQEPLTDKRTEDSQVMDHSPAGEQRSVPGLQDLFSSQAVVLLGLIAQLTDSALQDDIAIVVKRLHQLGRDVLKGSMPTKGGLHDPQTSHPSGSYHPKTV